MDWRLLFDLCCVNWHGLLLMLIGGVVVGWCCLYGGCSLWFSCLRVFVWVDGML